MSKRIIVSSKILGKILDPYDYESELTQTLYALINPVFDYTNGGLKFYLGIDSSKTNTAISLITSTGRVIETVEVSGRLYDTHENYLFLNELDNVARQVIRLMPDFEACFIEDVISTINTEDSGSQKKIVKGYKGQQVSYLLYNVHAAWVKAIYEVKGYDVPVHMINNFTWKKSTLPGEYLKSTFKGKGSLAYLGTIDLAYRQSLDDVTDSICIAYHGAKVGGVFDDKPWRQWSNLKSTKGEKPVYQNVVDVEAFTRMPGFSAKNLVYGITRYHRGGFSIWTGQNYYNIREEQNEDKIKLKQY